MPGGRTLPKDEVNPSRIVGSINGEDLENSASDPQNEELQRSSQILRDVLNALPSEQRGELIELLQTITKESASRKLKTSLKSAAEQIVATICRNDISPCVSVGYEPERRTGDRRKSDRRQWANNSYTAWTPEDIRLLKDSVRQNLPLTLISRQLGRTPSAVEAKARSLGVILPSIE